MKKIRVFIIKNNDILFYRKIEIKIINLDDVKDLILLEMQRSFDYYERQTFGEEIKKVFFYSKIVRIVRIFFSNCTDCTDFLPGKTHFPPFF